MDHVPSSFVIAVLTGPPVGGRGVPPAGGAAHAAAPVRLLATVGSYHATFLCSSSLATITTPHWRPHIKQAHTRHHLGTINAIQNNTFDP